MHSPCTGVLMANQVAAPGSASFRFHPARMVASLALAAALSACQEPPPAFSPPSLAGSWHMPDSVIVDFCATLEWGTCRNWLVTDDQRLNRGDGTYGAIAYIAPSPALASFTGPGNFTNLQPVAFVRVKADPGDDVHETYRALDLVPGFNCIYLIASGAQWDAHVLPPVAGDDPCPDVPQAPQRPPLKVIPVSTPGFGNPGDVPAVARFHEGRGRLGDQWFFGVKCGAAWCMIMPRDTDSLAVPHKGLVPTERRWMVRGWHDAQHLAVRTSAGLQLSREIVGTAAPGPAASYDLLSQFEDSLVHAATVHFRNAPGDKTYKDDWKFRQGLNEIFIAKRPNSDDWAGRIRVKGFLCKQFPGLDHCYKDLKVEREPHTGAVIPATARFRWEELDEGVWVRCADGCCKVSGT